MVTQIHADKKFIVEQHVKTAKHTLNMRKGEEGATSQQTLRSCLQQKPKQIEQNKFNEDLCQAMIASNIPLTKVNNQNLKQFLQKYCKYNIPDESTMRKKCVDTIFEETLLNIRNAVSSNYFYVVVDESTDSCGRYIAHALIGVLGEQSPGRSFLFASKKLEKTNNLSITRFVQDSLTNFFLPDVVPSEKFILYLSDAAPYMLKAGQNLKIFYPNLVHVTCLAHGINRVAECIREQFPLVNDLINYIKKVFLKAPIRIQFYKEHAPNLALPPQPVITRWGTWLDAAGFYADNYEVIEGIIHALNDSSSTALMNSKKLFENPVLKKNLIFIKTNYSFVSSTLLKLETTCMSLTESVALIDQFESDCEKVSGEIGSAILKKFNTVVQNNSGFQILKNVSQTFVGNFGDDINVSELKANIVSKYKYAPITSVDVERSFSIFKHMFTDKRQSFLLENFEKHLIINCFYNHRKT